MLLHHAFIQSAKEKGSKLAFIDKTRNVEVSYSRALIGALMLTKRISQFEDDYIGIMLPTSAGAALSIAATMMAGKIPVMINYSTGAENNCHFAQRKCHFKTILTSRTLLQKVGCEELDGMVFVEDIMAAFSKGDKLRAALLSKLPASLLIRKLYKGSEDDTAVILFTSGSEKEPKGVELTHRNIQTNIAGVLERFQFTDADIMLAVLPVFHVFGFSTILWLPLLYGMTTITYANPLEFKTIAGIIRDDKPTILIATPYFLLNYLRQSEPGDMSSLRYVVAGADKVGEKLFDAYVEQQGIEIIEGYGTTETSPVISVNPPDDNRRGSVGLPLEGVQVKIIDIFSGRELAAGEEGKILVRGAMVMKGYFNNLEETSLKIEDGWYETGDIGVLDVDGYIWHRGRLKRFVKIAGEMISLVHIESVLEGILPDDVDVCVVELPDAKKGAMVAVALNHVVDESEMRQKLAQHLPSLALPRYYVVMEELPKMGSGKVDFRTTTEAVQRHLGIG